eukprot:tig00000101_g4443.t1
MPVYSALVTTAQRVEPAEVAKLAAKVGSIFLSKGGVVMGMQVLADTTLAYPIKKHREKHVEGTRFVMHLVGSPEAARQFDADLQKDIRAIRARLYKSRDY